MQVRHMGLKINRSPRILRTLRITLLHTPSTKESPMPRALCQSKIPRAQDEGMIGTFPTEDRRTKATTKESCFRLQHLIQPLSNPRTSILAIPPSKSRPRSGHIRHATIFNAFIELPHGRAMWPRTFRLFLCTPNNVEIPTLNPRLKDRGMET